MTAPQNIPEEKAREMFARAEAALANTYPDPNSGHAVTVLTDQGDLFEGVSYKSQTQTLTMHSEATALANAAIHGQKNILAITGPNCHICKQLIWESALNSGIDTLVLTEEDGQILQTPISELMPMPWLNKEGSI